MINKGGRGKGKSVRSEYCIIELKTAFKTKPHIKRHMITAGPLGNDAMYNSDKYNLGQGTEQKDLNWFFLSFPYPFIAPSFLVFHPPIHPPIHPSIHLVFHQTLTHPWYQGRACPHL